MRPPKSRSRSRSNRRSPMGNVVNRVFDSSGPQGKVRGTPQQIIDKYLTLARDAQLSNDRVAAENFLQHAEHYARLLSDAQRESEARHEQQLEQQKQEQQNRNRENHSERDGQDTERAARAREDGGDSPTGSVDRRDDSRARNKRQDDRGSENTPGESVGKAASTDHKTWHTEHPNNPEVIDLSENGGSTLVETPENAAEPRKPRTTSARPKAARKKSDVCTPEEPPEDRSGTAR